MILKMVKALQNIPFKKVIIGSLAVSILFLIISIVRATPPTSPYRPGETLDPSCSPSDPNCTVSAPLPTYISTTTIVELNNNLLSFNTGTVSILGNLGIGTITPAYKLTVNGDIYVSATSTLGSATSTPVILGGYVKSDIAPYSDLTYNLGLSNYRWANLYVSTTTISNSLFLSSLTPGSVLFAGSNGQISQNNQKLFWDNTNFRLGIGTSTPAGILHIVTGTTDALFVDNLGNVGIGTTEPLDFPSANLNVVKTSTDTSGVIVGNIDSYLGINPTATSSAIYLGVSHIAEVPSNNTQNLPNGFISASYMETVIRGVDQSGNYLQTNGAWGRTRLYTPIDYPYGVSGQILNYSTSGSVFDATGVNGFVDNLRTGTITSASALWGKVRNWGGGTITKAIGVYSYPFANYSGTIDNAYGVFIDTGYNAGTINNNYGLYISNQTAGINNYAIYSAGGKVYFAGDVGIGTTTPISLLELSRSNTSPILTITSATSTIYSPYIQFRTGVNPSTKYVVGVNIADNKLKLVSGSDISTSTGITIDSSGNVGIGTTTPAYKLSVQGSIQQTNAVNCALSADANGQIICTPSSLKYKENIQDLTFDSEKFLSLQPRSFEFKKDLPFYLPGKQVGFVAEEVQNVFPNLVRYKDGEPEGVKYESLPIYLFAIIKDFFNKMKNGILNFKEIVVEKLWGKYINVHDLETEKITPKVICSSTGKCVQVTDELINKLIELSGSNSQPIPASNGGNNNSGATENNNQQNSNNTENNQNLGGSSTNTTSTSSTNTTSTSSTNTTSTSSTNTTSTSNEVNNQNQESQTSNNSNQTSNNQTPSNQSNP